MSQSQPYRQDLNWLVTEFTTRVEDVAHAIVVSADGVPLSLSTDIPKQAVEQFSAIVSGLTSLMLGASRVFEGGTPTQALVEMEGGLLFVKAISDGSSLAVLAAPECDTRQVSFEMTRLVGAVGELLTPPARAEVLTRGQLLSNRATSVLTEKPLLGMGNSGQESPKSAMTFSFPSAAARPSPRDYRPGT